MTIIEVVVAAVILALGALAAFGVLSAATKNNQRAKASQVALNRAQQELEAMRSLTNSQLAMTAAPLDSTNPLNPNYRVNEDSYDLRRQPPRLQHRQPLRRRLRQRRHRQPGPDPVHQWRRQRQHLPLRGLAQRRELPPRHLPRGTGLQADRRRGEAGYAREPVR
jgi:hypothetical protein